MRSLNPKYKYLFFNSILILFLAGCSNTKFLNEGELLYVGGEVIVNGEETSRGDRKRLAENMETLLRPKPNTSFLGLRPKLYFYNIAGDSVGTKGFRYWLKNKMGEPPVLFSQVDLDYNAELVNGYAENKGYFNARTSADSTAKNKKATAEYTVELGSQYLYKEIDFPTDSIAVTAAIATTKENTLLKVGEPYDLDVIKAERVRIDANLKEKGYYYFNPDYLLAKVDSTAGEKEVWLKMVLKDETPPEAKETYRINNIYIFPDYSLAEDSLIPSPPVGNKYGDFTIIDPKGKFKPKMFERTLLFEKGELYNRTDHNKSINRLVNLGTFKFVKNQFSVSDSATNLLDTYYYLTPLPKKSIRLELLGKTNSANYAGSEINLSWTNRNTFKGAEELKISAHGGLFPDLGEFNPGIIYYIC